MASFPPVRSLESAVELRSNCVYTIFTTETISFQSSAKWQVYAIFSCQLLPSQSINQPVPLITRRVSVKNENSYKTIAK